MRRYCSLVWIMNGGRIPWNVTVICEIFRRNFLMKTPCERRFGMPFNGPVIPFGAMVEYHPISAKDQSRLHQFGSKVLPGIFLDYASYAVRICKGDIMVADIEELEQMDASELHARRLNTTKKWKLHFPSRMEPSKFTGGDRYLRTSTFTWHRPERGEESENLQGNSDEWYTPSKLEEDPTRDDEEAKNDFWTITGEFITAITLYQESNCTCRKKKHSLFRRSTSTSPEPHMHP